MYLFFIFLRGDWTLFGTRVKLLRSFNLSIAECGILPAVRGLAFRSACIGLHLSSNLWRHYFVLLGSFCSSSYLLSIVYLLGHLLSILYRHLHCSRFLYFMNKEELRCFGLSILLHMVEVCSMVISFCYLLHTHI